VIAALALAAALAADLEPAAGSESTRSPRTELADGPRTEPGSPRSEVFECPKGTTRVGAPPPDDFAIWCERPGLDGRPRREGEARTWYDDGALRLTERWRDGERDGPFVEYHRSGRKAREGAWENGRKDGTWTIWFEEGGLEEVSTFRAGVSDGPFVAYHRSGAKRTEGRHCGGPQCGVWRTFDERGREIGVVRYDEQTSAP
jgi:hypothetical protein